MATKWQSEPKRWRVRGKASDGLIVTLGRHDTEAAADADAQKLRNEQRYRDVTVEPIEPTPESPPADS